MRIVMDLIERTLTALIQKENSISAENSIHRVVSVRFSLFSLSTKDKQIKNHVPVM